MNIFFISLYDEGHRDLHNAFYRMKKILIFHGDMSLRSWYFIRVNRVFQGVFLGILSYKIQKVSPPRVFKIFTRGFRRYKGAAIAKKRWEPIFDFLIQEFFITILLLSKKKFSIFFSVFYL